MSPEQIVEFLVVRGRMVIAVPPEPVAAFGNQNLFASLSPGLVVGLADAVKDVARLGQLTPSSTVIGMADPDVKIRVDPRTGKNARQALVRTAARLRHGHRPKFGMAREALIQGAEK